MARRKRICFVVSSPMTAIAFLSDHINRLGQNFDVYLVANFESADSPNIDGLAGIYSIRIVRKISIVQDIKSVLTLRKYFALMKFDAVHSVTPKAGLTTALAARLAGVKHRIHIYTGQVWATRKGVMRWMLRSMDKLIAILDNHILVDGNSQRDFLIQEKVISPKRSIVLGAGSICGVNVKRFAPSEQIRQRCRQGLGISDDKLAFVFMGRLNRDKGMYELLHAFNRLTKERSDVFLLIFGRDEENIVASFPQFENLNASNFLYYGATSEPHNMLQAGDVFVLPTYREGFGSSVIEAACLGLPTITSDAYGVLDASVKGETGLQCKVGDIDSLYEAMSEMCSAPTYRKRMGMNGRKRVLSKFAGDTVVKNWCDFYHNILE